MTINNIPGPFRATSTITPPKVKASVEGLYKPITVKVSEALSDNYIEQVKAQARTDAAKGSYMDGYDKSPRTGFSAIMDAQMKQYVSPDRATPISRVSVALNDSNRIWNLGENILDLIGIPCTAKVSVGLVYGKSAQIYNSDDEMIAAYSDRRGGWFDIPTADESRFQYESTQIYYAAYNEAKAEMAAAQQTITPAASDDASASFDVKA